MEKRVKILAILFVALLMVSTATGEIIYVDADATGANNGSSWAHAYNDLQDALAFAYSGDEIRVAQGIYTPDHGGGNTPGSRTATFRLKNGVAILGGYAGFGQPSPNHRNIAAYETILSGDLADNDGPDFVNYGDNSYHVVTGSGTNSTAVLDAFTITGGNADAYQSNSGLNNMTLIPPIPFDPKKWGGGMYNDSGSPTINNCIFSSNSSGYGGAAVYNKAGSSPTLSKCTFNGNHAKGNGGGIYNCGNCNTTLLNCTFSGNIASSAGGMDIRPSNRVNLVNCIFIQNSVINRGGAICSDHSDVTMTNCIFTQNKAGWDGGGINNSSGRPVLTNCTFSGNSAGKKGGGMHSDNGTKPTLANCTFTRNSAGELGGGMYTWGGEAMLTNCRFSENSATWGGGAYNDSYNTSTLANCTITNNKADRDGGGICTRGANTTITNCILWGDTVTEGHEIALLSYKFCYSEGCTFRPSLVTVSYSDVQGGAEGIYIDPNSTINWCGGNIDADPCFVDADNGDYHLLVDSQCIDAGNNNSIPSDFADLDGDGDTNEPTPFDLDGNPRIMNYVVDMGTYEFELLYVDDDAIGANNGSSWADAYNDLQDALEVALTGGEIRVAQGIYKPAPPPSPQPPPGPPLPPPPSPPTTGLDDKQVAGTMPGDRTASFQLKNGVTIKGGYAGAGAQDPNVRDIQLYETILSGDLSGNDKEVKNPCELLDDPCRAENSYHVVTANVKDASTLLDGFTITGGNANGSYPYGGGMYSTHYRSPTVANCTFLGNSAIRNGGGVNGSPAITNCTFMRNYADEKGGGMYIMDPTILNCDFIENSASDGGAIFCAGPPPPSMPPGLPLPYPWLGPTIANCTLIGNSANSGGGLYNRYTAPKLTNCIFSGNLASVAGGGMLIYYKTQGQLINCTFAGNSALNGNAMACKPSSQRHSSNLQVSNCILWDGGNEIWNDGNSTFTFTYSNVHGGWPGEGNIDSNPFFVEPGYWDANGVWIEGDYHLLPGSPCIDAGDPAYVAEPNETDLDSKPRIIGGRIDMGAYEYSPPIWADVDIEPDTLNMTSKGKWITAFIQMPEDYDMNDIDANSVYLEGEIKAEQFWLAEDNQIAIARFSREEVQAFLTVGEVELTITGQLKDGISFEGTDVIRVIGKGGSKN